MNPDASERSKPSEASNRLILVWDLPTRLFHWLLVMLVIASFATGKIGGLWMQYHMWSGYAIFGLLLFRVAWGFVGGRHARFSNFVYGPGAVLRYARTMLNREASRHLGHNPLGGWSVLAMLIALLVQAVTGLFANDDIFIEGPLYPWVSKATSDWLTHIHKLNQEVILLLVAVHVVAVFFYLILKHENLIRPMFTGRKHWGAEDQSSTNLLGMAALIASLLALGVFLLVR
ncbi:cytochrome b/b6 domain-containing protein [uncultured Desulfosarcina sp.]|uniref:cytochrome b/b6 domain-containing protein n=1 Tax=uncultured Desulfosarcina sp. TaxID=218289 RepID=UPI0029C6610B|nr:cytochrome b/b6 domain-containing protein [uncultured Desulfosarcina sp.]